MVEEHHPAEGDAGIHQLPAELKGPVVAGFQKHKAGAVYIGEQLREILEVPGVEQFFALSPRREGKAEPSLTGGGLPQMVIMEGLYPKRAVGQNTIGDQVRLYVEDRFKNALSHQGKCT